MECPCVNMESAPTASIDVVQGGPRGGHWKRIEWGETGGRGVMAKLTAVPPSRRRLEVWSGRTWVAKLVKFEF